MSKKHHITTTVNGDECDFLCEAQQTLLDCLRDELMLSGTKEGCATGDCGACTVMVDGVMVCSCLVLGVEVDGLQCGICTPGILIAARELLARNPDPTETEIRYWLAGNLCRCTGYDKIIPSVQAAAKEMRGEAS